MRLLSYNAGSGPRAGVMLDGGRIADVSMVLGTQQTLHDVQALLEQPDRPVERLRDVLANRPPVATVSASEVRLLPPVLRPPTVRDFNAFEGHAGGAGTRELPDAWYRLPIFYFSNPLVVYGPEDEVPYPSASQRFDYELEIGAVIGQEGSNLSEQDGMEHIAGFTIFNDWSARDLQRDEMAAGLGPAKGKDCGNSFGPYVVTADELAAKLKDGRLHVECRLTVNGETWMTGNAGSMHHTWGSFVERAARDSRVAVGDVLGSGTVSGGSIGEAIRNGHRGARFLQPGDIVEMEVEGIGTLRNRIGPKRVDSTGYRYMAREQPPMPAPAVKA
jgi:2-keto-4-pentenoate hydratase/2-oxohepta-3-ene-1,7-dioic acid hydratase in catechol pathway